MKILVLNCGSSSVKYRLFEMGRGEHELLRGQVERIGLDDPRQTVQLSDGSRFVKQVNAPDHRHAIQIALRFLTHSKYGIISFLHEIEAVGHRVVHGGELFPRSVVINEEVKRSLYELQELAPLHNPFNLIGIEVMASILPDIPQVGVFDTSFHQTLPRHAYLYALPFQLYEKYKIRRYGFHGTSHRYVVQEAARFIGRPLKELKLVSCHLGNGASIAAIKCGQSVDTSMGFTPLEGLVMGTRCGDLDPSVVLFLMRKEVLDAFKVSELLNRKSGLLGISCYTSDIRELEEAAYKDKRQKLLNTDHPYHRQAKLALDIFCYRLKKYIGAYAAAMGGLDAVIFTGGIGEQSTIIPEDACASMSFIGIEMGARTELEKGCYELSKPSSRVRVLVIPTNEELMIARDTYQILRGL